MNGLGGVSREQMLFSIEEVLRGFSLKREEDLAAIHGCCVNWHVSYRNSIPYQIRDSEKLMVIVGILSQTETARNRLERLVSSIVEIVKQHLHVRDETGIFSEKQEKRLVGVCTPLFSRTDVRNQLVGLSAAGFSLFQRRVQEHFSRLIQPPSSIEKCCCGNRYQLASYASLPPQLAQVWIDEAVRTHGLVADIRERFEALVPSSPPTPPLPDD